MQEQQIAARQPAGSSPPRLVAVYSVLRSPARPECEYGVRAKLQDRSSELPMPRSP